MSYDPDDARREQWEEEQAAFWDEQLYEEHYEQAVLEFTGERLGSFYRDHPNLASAAFGALDEAERLLDAHASASLVFAATATEIALRKVLLEPVVHGFVHSESAAVVIAELTMGHQVLKKFKQLLFQVLREVGGIDFETYMRTSARKLLWEEVQTIWKQRHGIVHRGETVSSADAENAIAVASKLLTSVIPTLLARLKLELSGTTIRPART